MTETTQPIRGIKFDQGKLRWDLVPFDMLTYTGRVPLTVTSANAVYEDGAYADLFFRNMMLYQNGYKAPEVGLRALAELTHVTILRLTAEMGLPVYCDVGSTPLDAPWWESYNLDAIEEVIKVLTFGVKKYSAWNWVYIPDRKARYFAAAFRHQRARMKGEQFDPETEVRHTAHISCCLWFTLASELQISDPRFDKWLFEIMAEQESVNVG